MEPNKTKIKNALAAELEFRKWALEQAVIYTANHNYTLKSAFDHIYKIVKSAGEDRITIPCLISSRATEIYNMQRNAERLIKMVKSGQKPQPKDIVLSKEQFAILSKIVADDPEYLKCLFKYVPDDYEAFTSVK